MTNVADKSKFYFEEDNEEFKIEDDIKKQGLGVLKAYSEKKDSYKKHLEDMHPSKIHKTRSEIYSVRDTFQTSFSR